MPGRTLLRSLPHVPRRFDTLRRITPVRGFASLRFDGRDGLLLLVGSAVILASVPLLPRTLSGTATVLVACVGLVPFTLPFLRRWWFGPPPPRLLRTDRLLSLASLVSLVLLAAALVAVVVASFAAWRLSVEPKSPFDLGGTWYAEHREVGVRWLLGSLSAALLLAVIAFRGLEARYEAAPTLRRSR